MGTRKTIKNFKSLNRSDGAMLRGVVDTPLRDAVERWDRGHPNPNRGCQLWCGFGTAWRRSKRRVEGGLGLSSNEIRIHGTYAEIIESAGFNCPKRKL